MNPYLSVTLAMCAIVLLSLIGTAYLAVVFNRRAKADLARALDPLAAVIEGDADIDEAFVRGRYHGQIAEGRMTTSFMGPGRVFHSLVIDGAGGVPWTWTVSRGKLAQEPPTAVFETSGSDLEPVLTDALTTSMMPLTAGSPWSIVEYDPAAGHLRLTRPMQTRRDIPAAATFQAQLDGLREIARVNRSLQNPGS